MMDYTPTPPVARGAAQKLLGHQGKQLMKFEPGNALGKGRPRGARNKLASRVLQDLLEVWDEPIIEGKALTRGKAALRTMSRERPSDFAKLYAGIMPREFWVESVATELADDELELMIKMLRERLLTAPEEQSLPKIIEHAH
jgi:hypothetical protein